MFAPHMTRAMGFKFSLTFSRQVWSGIGMLYARCGSFDHADQFFKLLVFLRLTNTDPFATRLVVTWDATPDGTPAVRSVLGAISSLPIAAFRK